MLAVSCFRSAGPLRSRRASLPPLSPIILSGVAHLRSLLQTPTISTSVPSWRREFGEPLSLPCRARRSNELTSPSVCRLIGNGQAPVHKWWEEILNDYLIPGKLDPRELILTHRYVPSLSKLFARRADSFPPHLQHPSRGCSQVLHPDGQAPERHRQDLCRDQVLVAALCWRSRRHSSLSLRIHDSSSNLNRMYIAS